MRKIKRSLLGFWVLISIILFKCLFIFYAWQTLKNLQRNIGHGYALPVRVLSKYDIIVFLVLLLEVLIYWILRFKIRNIGWVRLHAWTLFGFMVLVPLFIVVISSAASRSLGNYDYYYFSDQIRRVRIYMFWILLPLAHIFFIATIVKSFRPIKEIKNNDGDSGLFDEFID